MPEATTGNARIIRELDRRLAGEGERVARWFDERFAQTPAPACAAVGLRHAGLKLAPVAADPFPAGFRNLGADGRRRAAAAFRGLLAARYAGARRVLLVADGRAGSGPRVDDLRALRAVLEEAGAEVRLGDIAADPAGPLAPAGEPDLVPHPLERRGDRIAAADGFEPDLILLGHDPGAGAPAILDGLAQPVAPPDRHRRREGAYLAAYDALARDFAGLLGLDPWLLAAHSLGCGRVNLRERAGLERVAGAVDEVVALTRAKYREHGCDAEPYAFVKAERDGGGAGVVTVRSGEEVVSTVNRHRRHGMRAGRGGVLDGEVVVQEGVPTVDLVDGAPAEPVVYLVDGGPVGGLYRPHHARGEYDSLSAAGPGFAALCGEAGPELAPGAGPDDGAGYGFRVLGTLARLAALALVAGGAAEG